ncbi:MAG TPA: DUF3592 domain-containing protein [Candidatus Saccharimonadales bacterium]
MTKKQKLIKKKTIILQCVLIVLLLLTIAVAVFFFSHSIANKRTLSDKGEQVNGVVEKHDLHISTSRSTSLTTRKIDYSFVPKESKEKVIKTDFNVSRVEYEKYPLGSKIPITYLPSDTSENEPTASLRHMPAIAEPFIYLTLVIVFAIFCSKIVKKLQVKYNVKQPGMLFYLTSLAGFMVAFVIAMITTVIVAQLVRLLLL